MMQFIEAVDQALASESWLAALSLSLTLPDICGRLTDQSVKSSEKRYVAWWDRYLLDRYTMSNWMGKHVFLSGRDAYALRCAYLHEGQDDTTNQRAKDAITRFKFVQPVGGATGVYHCNAKADVLILQVNVFCKDVCDGVRNWLHDHANDAAVAERQDALLTIQFIRPGVEFAI